jgi:hypothetical protein
VGRSGDSARSGGRVGVGEEPLNIERRTSNIER